MRNNARFAARAAAAAAVLAMAGAPAAQTSAAYTYDALGRVTEATYGSTTTTYL
jgi:hypothetical protein